MALKHNYFHRVATSIWILAAGMLMVVLPTACKPQSRTDVIEDVSHHTEPVAHIKHSERLSMVMREINELSLSRLPQEMGTSLSQRRRMASIGAIAERLSQSALELPKYANELDLTDDQRASFIKLAGFLHEEARELGAIAHEGAKPAFVQAKLNEMVSTCNACHHLFRDPAAGDLVPPPEV